MAKESIVFIVSEEFKETIAQAATDANVSVGELIRVALAEKLGYDLAGEPSVERRKKYANKAERDKAMRERAKERRTNERELLEALRQASKAQDIAGMREYLEKKGVVE